MRKNQKRGALVIGLCLAVSLFVGCGSQDSSSVKETGTEQETVVERETAGDTDKMRRNKAAG